MNETLTFAEVRKATLSRVEEWHGLNKWSVMEWACAMAGEAGETCNVAKKMSRIEGGFAYRKEEIGQDLTPNLAEEAADTFIYLDLLCASRGIDLAEAVKKKFNSVSEAYGFSQRIP